MNKYTFFSVLVALVASGCSLDEVNVCANGECECFIDNDGSENLQNCALHIPKNSHVTGCSDNETCEFACDAGYVSSDFEGEVTCILEDNGCNPKRFSKEICRENRLSKCDETTGLWTTLHQCTEGCSEDHCQNTCDEDDIGKYRCLDGGIYQICTHNDYENIWENSDKCIFGCNPQTNECNDRADCKLGLADNGKDCVPWIESSEDALEIDTTLKRTIKLFYFGPSGTPEAGKNFELDVTRENCIELSRTNLLSGPNGTELTITAGKEPCKTSIVIKVDKASENIDVTVREPLDENHNRMFDVLEPEHTDCLTDKDCPGDSPFCDSFLGFKCSARCTSNADCISEAFFCRDDGRCAPKAFETLWETTAPNAVITIPTEYATECDFTIDWGDGNDSEPYTCPHENITHTYKTAGIYHVKITGTYNNWAFVKKDNKGTDFCKHFKGVISYGPVGLAGKNHWVFYNCKDFDYTEPAIDIPDATKLTNMAYMFMGDTAFNQNISNWDTSNVTNLSHTFENASSFNQPIGKWNTSKVTTLNSAFKNAAAFNQDLDHWDTSNVEHMQEVFASTKSFNGKISTWNTQNVMKMSYMFQDAEAFNQPLKWDVGKVTTMSHMFTHAKSFNEALDFTFGSTCSYDSMFEGAESFNHPSINNWDVSKGYRFISMFKNAKSFNQPLTNWRPDSDTMDAMFQGAESFNQNISSWNPKYGKNLGNFFDGASAYNQPLDWNFNAVASTNNVSNMFRGTKLSKDNYCKTVKGKKIEKYASALGVTFTPADCE